MLPVLQSTMPSTQFLMSDVSICLRERLPPEWRPSSWKPESSVSFPHFIEVPSLKLTASSPMRNIAFFCILGEAKCINHSFWMYTSTLWANSERFTTYHIRICGFLFLLDKSCRISEASQSFHHRGTFPALLQKIYKSMNMVRNFTYTQLGRSLVGHDYRSLGNSL